MKCQDIRLTIAVEVFRRGLISVGKAAELAGLPLQAFIEELRKRGIPAYRYNDEEATRELKIEDKLESSENTSSA